MTDSKSSETMCVICEGPGAEIPEDEPQICSECYWKSESLFDEEMRRTELIRTIRGMDVELYDIKHPDAATDKNHCGQVVLIRAGDGFEVKICLRSGALDWMAKLSDDAGGFVSPDNRLDALIGNVSLLIESWGGGPYYMDIFHVERVISTEGEL